MQRDRQCLQRVNNKLSESAEFKDIKAIIQAEDLPAEIKTEDLEMAVKSVLKFHNGRVPSTALVVKWLRNQKPQNQAFDDDMLEVSKRARLQNALERLKLLDFRHALGCHLQVKFAVNGDRNEDKLLHKEIFEAEMQMSVDEDKSLKTIEENFENEWMTTEKKKNTRELVLQDPTQLHHDKRESYKVLINGEEEDEKNSKSIYEISKIERALFRSRSKDKGSPLPYDYQPHVKDNDKSGMSQEFTLDGRTSRPRVSDKSKAVDPIQDIKNKALELEKLVRTEIEMCEERAAMTGLLTAFRELLTKYEDNSFLEKSGNLGAKKKKQKIVCSSREQQNRKAISNYLGLDRILADRAKKAGSPSDTRSHSRNTSKFDIYNRRQPLQALNSNKQVGKENYLLPSGISQLGIQTSGVGGISTTSSFSGVGLNRFTASAQRDRSMDCIDLTVLKNHNFSVDLIQAFHNNF